MKKSQKTSYLENYKDSSSHIMGQDFQPLRQLRQPPTTGLGASKLEEKKTFFSETFQKKITKNVISRKLQRIEQSYLEAKFATTGSTIEEPQY